MFAAFNIKILKAANMVAYVKLHIHIDKEAPINFENLRKIASNLLSVF